MNFRPTFLALGTSALALAVSLACVRLPAEAARATSPQDLGLALQVPDGYTFMYQRVRLPRWAPRRPPL